MELFIFQKNHKNKLKLFLKNYKKMLSKKNFKIKKKNLLNSRIKLRIKSQISIEFIYMIMFGSFFLIIFTLVFSDLYKDVLYDKKNKLFYDFGISLQNEFILASEVKEGYQREIFLPEKLENFEYNIEIIDNMLLINYTTDILTFPIPKVKGNLKKGNNILFFNGSLNLI